MSTENQGETRNQMVGAAVTPSEKRFVELVATVEGRPLSQLIRERGVDALIERGREIADRLAKFPSIAA